MKMNTRLPATSRFDGIDVLCGLSILAVMFLHMNLRMQFALLYAKVHRDALPPWFIGILLLTAPLVISPTR